MMFGEIERVRGHRRGGTVPQHKEQRHDFITPIVLMTAAIVSSVAAAGVGIYSAVSSASANQTLQDTQAKALEQQARTQEDTAAYEERQFRRKAAFLMGKQHAIYGASGLDPSSGSPLLQEIDTARQAEIEALNIRRGGQVAAATSRFESGLARYRSDYYGSTIAPSIIGGLASGTSSVLSSWMKFK